MKNTNDNKNNIKDNINQNKLNAEIQSFKDLWVGGYFNDVNKNDFRNLHDIFNYCLKHNTEDATVLEIGPGRGSWTKLMLNAKKIYCLDALSAEHNNFWEYVGDEKKLINYHKIKNFKCDMIPNNSIDLLFSYDVFCHISYSGTREYLKNLHPKIKKNAKCYIMVADYDKYLRFIESKKTKNNIVVKFIKRIIKPIWNLDKIHMTPGYNSIEEEVADYDGAAYPGRWYYYGIDRFCSLLEEFNYTIIKKDIGVDLRSPICYFTKI